MVKHIQFNNKQTNPQIVVIMLTTFTILNNYAFSLFVYIE